MKLNALVKIVALLAILLSINAQANQAPLTKIIGGEDAKASEWSFIVPLVKKGESAFFGQFCAGSLINSRYVLTAAHCVDDLSAYELEVIIDIYDLGDESSSTRVSIKNIVSHEDYDNEILGNNDIALLELSEEVAGTFIELATTSFLDSMNAGDTVKIAGWGNMSNFTSYFPEILQQVDLPYVDRTVCQSLDSSSGYSQIDESTICAGYAEGGYDSCGGDSGGPLIIDDNGTSKLLGIVSWGAGCAEPDAYGVYTNVAYFKGNDWIYKNTLISYEPSIDLGYVEIDLLHHKILTIANNDKNRPLNILNITSSSGFTISENNCLVTLESGDSCSVLIELNPNEVEMEGAITFATDNPSITEFTSNLTFTAVERAEIDLANRVDISDVEVYSNRFPWLVINDGIQSGHISDNEESVIMLNNLPEGTLSFDLLVSSEPYYDFAKILVNGELSSSISGNYDNTLFIPLSKVSNKVTFIYTKDSSLSGNNDTVSIRNLTLGDPISLSDSNSSLDSSSSGGATSYSILILLGMGFMLRRKES